MAVAERATKDEAQALVKKAAEYVKANGPDKAYAEFDKKDGSFVDRDLYIVVYDTNGKCLAHGSNPKLIGKDLMDAEDADGKDYVKERVTLAKTQTTFWQEYKFADPISKKISPKETYCEVVSGTIVCGGIYKQ
jgi:signal transduction histidine kinase